MSYSMVASDWDDTLVPLGATIPDRTRAALERVRAQGTVLAVASGRSVHGLQVQLKRNAIDLGGLYFIAYNGALAVQAWDEEVLFGHPLGLDLAARAARMCADAGAAVMIHHGRRLLSDQPDHFAVRFEADSNDLDVVKVHDFSALDFVPVKLLVGGDKEQLTKLCRAMRTEFAHEGEAMLSADFLMEFTARHVNKGSALRGLCEAIDIPLGEVVAFGDNYNDIPMMNVAGYSVAVADGVPELLSIVDEVTAPSSESGVADVLDELLPA